MTFSFIQMYETSQRASSPSMDVATAAEIKVSELVSAETVIERLTRGRCSKTPKFAISDETLSALSCNQDHRELQRQITRRTAERDAVPIAATCPCGAGSLATRLQRGSAPFQARLDGAWGLRQVDQRRARPGRCATPRLRAPASRHPSHRRSNSTPDSRHPWTRNGGHVSRDRRGLATGDSSTRQEGPSTNSRSTND